MEDVRFLQGLKNPGRMEDAQDTDHSLHIDSVNDTLQLSGQSLSEDCATSHDISICTPPRRQTLAEQLISAPESELETLLDQVLERRPELRSKFGESKKTVKPMPVVETAIWDLDLIDNRDMYRDDRGGWVDATIALSEKYKTVGWDFRGLPIVHVGRGRPKTRMVRLLQKNPAATGDSLLSEEMTSSSAGLATLDLPTSPVIRSEPEKVVYSADQPRTSQRLHKKRARREIITKPEGEAESPTGILKTSPGILTEVEADSSTVIQNMEVAEEIVLEEPDDYEVPTDVVSEVSITMKRTHRYTCTDCDLVFKSLGLYRKHISLPDCAGFPKRCYMCQERIQNKSHLFIHEQSQCYLNVSQPLPAEVDLEEWAASRYTCGLCTDAYSTEAELLEHARVIHSSLPIFRCRLCENAYHELRPLRNHFTKSHTIQQTFVCSLCEKSLISERSLTTHMKYAHMDVPSLSCPLCDKQLKSKKAFNHHMSCIHENNKPFKCQYCEKSFVAKANLDLHIKAHRGIRDHMCDICGATFLQKIRLTEHVRAHTGVKEFSCPTCSKSFYTLKDLNGHKRIHTNIKNYACMACGKTFAQSQTLKKHLMTHSDAALSFKCQFCIKAFKSSATVYKHCRMAHRDKLTAFCSFCSLWFVSKADLNRHNHYKHIWMYDGRAEEKTFLSSTAELTEDLYTDLNTSAAALNDQEATSYECVCGVTFSGVNELAIHIQTSHPEKELAVGMAADNVIYQQPKPLDPRDTEGCGVLPAPNTAGSCGLVVDELETNSIDLVTDTGLSHRQEVVSLTPPLEEHQVEITPSSTSLSSTSPLTRGESGSKIYQLSTAATGLTEIHQVFTSLQQQQVNDI